MGDAREISFLTYSKREINANLMSSRQVNQNSVGRQEQQASVEMADGRQPGPEKADAFVAAIQAIGRVQDQYNVLDGDGYERLAHEVLTAAGAGKRTPLDRRRLARFRVDRAGAELRLSGKVKAADGSARFLPVVRLEHVYDVLDRLQREVGCGGVRALVQEAHRRYSNITRQMVSVFLQMRKQAEKERQQQQRPEALPEQVVERPVATLRLNQHCQVDMIDMRDQPDYDYKWVFKIFIRWPANEADADSIRFSVGQVHLRLHGPRLPIPPAATRGGVQLPGGRLHPLPDLLRDVGAVRAAERPRRAVRQPARARRGRPVRRLHAGQFLRLNWDSLVF